MDSLFMYLLLMFFLIQEYTTIKLKETHLSTVNCNTQVLSTNEEETVQLVLKRNGSRHFPDINGCYYAIQLNSWVRYDKLVVTVSVDIPKDCPYAIEIYPGDPTINRRIKKIKCDSDRNWIGPFPTKDIFLRYVYSKREEVNVTEDMGDILLTNVSFKHCKDCFQTPKMSSIRNSITDYCGQHICLGDKDLLYINDRYGASTSDFLPTSYSQAYRKFSICPYCRRIQFTVKDSIQLCLKAYAGTTYWDEGKGCRVTLEIDGRTALTLNSGLHWTWCLPWNVKGKTVKFTFGVDSGWDCVMASDRCAVEIQIVSLNKISQLCRSTTLRPYSNVTRYSTTTQSYQWSSWSSNTDVVDNDVSSSSDSDDHSRFPIIILCTVGGIVGLTICCTCCKNLCTSKSTRREEPYLRQEINMHSHMPQNDLYRRRSYEPNETQNMLDSQIIEPERTALDPLAPPLYDSVTIPTEEIFTSTSGDNTHVEHRDSPEYNISNRTPIVTAPPSYEDACKYYQLNK